MPVDETVKKTKDNASTITIVPTIISRIFSFIFFYQDSNSEWLDNKSAEFNALDKITARTKKLEISLNEEENLGSLIIILKSCQNRPPDYLPESAAYIEIFDLLNQSEDKQNLVFSGWMFSSSPAISALEHPIYDISLVSCK